MSEPTKPVANSCDSTWSIPHEELKNTSEQTTTAKREIVEKSAEPVAIVKLTKMLRHARKSTSGPHIKKQITVSIKKKSVVVKKTNSTLKTKPNHPPFIEMITEAIEKLNDRSGSSRQAILKYIVANFKVQEKSGNQHVKVVLKNAVKAGSLKQVKGVGASGSFKLSDSIKSKAKSQAKIQKQTTRKITTPVKKSPAKKVSGAVAIKKITSRLVKFSPVAKPKIAQGKKLASKKVTKVTATKRPVTKQAAKSKTKSSMANKKKVQTVQVKSKKSGRPDRK